MDNTLFIILYSLFFSFLSIKDLKWAIFWIIFTLPAYLIRFEISGIPMTLLEGQILLLFIVWIIKNIKIQEYKNIKIGVKKNLLFYFYIILFLLAATISVFVSPDLRAAAGLWKAYFIEPILFLIVFVSVIKKEDISKMFKPALSGVVGCLSVSVFLLSLFALYQKLTGAFIYNQLWAAEATRRVTSVFSYPNALALFLAPIVIMLIGFIVGARHRHVQNEAVPRSYVNKLFYFITVIAGLLAIYWTKSKGALLAILAGIIFYAIFYKGHRRIFIGILIITIITIITFITINPDFLKGTPTVEGGDSITTRLEMWQETWQMLKTKPILGAGLAGYQTAVAPFHQKDYIEIYLYPHNIFLNFWTEIGLLGLIAFIGIIIWFYKTGFSRLRVTSYELQVTIMSGMTALLVHGLVDVPYFKNDLSVLFWIIIGMMIILWRSAGVVERAALEKR